LPGKSLFSLKRTWQHRLGLFIRNKREKLKKKREKLKRDKCPQNINELNQHCKEETARIAP